jgi:hypothetical protein
MFPRRIDLVSGITGSEDVFTHELSLSGTNGMTMTLGVGENTNFTAVHKLTLETGGVLELDQGDVHTNNLIVKPGGLVRGNGDINGSLFLGTASGPGRAILSPGFSPGEITVNGDLMIDSNGELQIEIDSTSSFDFVTVTQDAELGGTLTVDITGVDPTTIDNTMFEILTAADVDQTFDNVVTVGNDDYFFGPEYDQNSVSLLLFSEGDMNLDGNISPDDVQAFAMAVTNPLGYFNLYEVFGEQSGDINDDGFFDFDDIQPFSNLPGISLTAEEVLAVIQSFNSAVPEPGSAVLALCGAAFLLAGRTRPVQVSSNFRRIR